MSSQPDAAGAEQPKHRMALPPALLIGIGIGNLSLPPDHPDRSHELDMARSFYGVAMCWRAGFQAGRAIFNARISGPEVLSDGVLVLRVTESDGEGLEDLGDAASGLISRVAEGLGGGPGDTPPARRAVLTATFDGVDLGTAIELPSTRGGLHWCVSIASEEPETELELLGYRHRVPEYWSSASHRDHTDRLRAVVTATLLAACRRLFLMPAELWPLIFAHLREEGGWGQGANVSVADI